VTQALARDNGRLDRIASALGGAVILVNTEGQIVWLNETTRRRVNGELRNLVLPIDRSENNAIDCFISAVEIMINCERSVLCVIQETSDEKERERDLMAAIQAVMTDTSWFTRTIMDKLKAWRQHKQPGGERSLDDVDVLSDREREVLGLICEGQSDAEMSKILQLSPNTVRNHITSLYRKIGVNRRSAAIIWARERGITGPELIAPKRRRRSPLIHHGAAQPK
jgi:DNA-binding CsgD family transcriptional regulator